ncbi:MAG: hypothetical protein KC445_21565, partial [Anaerolineales bacterium]|nr:hypothetical protein [Anaerolineales bacterium]
MQNVSSEMPTAVSTQNRQRWAMIGLLLALLAVFMLSLFVGSVRIPLDQILGILVGATPERETWTTIVLKFRLPK